jgi:hypothetical protein
MLAEHRESLTTAALSDADIGPRRDRGFRAARRGPNAQPAQH